MLKRMKGTLRGLLYRLRYGRSICIEGHPVLERASRINIINGKVHINKGFSMKTGAYIAVANGGNVMIGQSVAIARNSILVCHDSITIGDHCSIAPNVVIYDHAHKFGMDGIKSGYNTAPVVIEKNCCIGAGVTILRGTHIGEGCVIGAGCVVKGEIPPHSLVTSDRNLNITPIEDRR